jgi:hypothetical protein
MLSYHHTNYLFRILRSETNYCSALGPIHQRIKAYTAIRTGSMHTPQCMYMGYCILLQACTLDLQLSDSFQ